MATNPMKISHAQSQAFAKLSGDHNPIHLDPLYARRLPFGQSVVHGLHGVMLALDLLLAQCERPHALVKLKVRFSRPIGHDQPFTHQLQKKEGGHFRIKLQAQSHICTTLSGQLIPAAEVKAVARPDLPEMMAPHRADWKEIVAAEGTIPLHWSCAEGRALFPHLGRRLQGDQAAVLLALTRLVGMWLPGEHSLFGGFTFRFASIHTHEDPCLTYRVTHADEARRLLELSLEGAMGKGGVSAFVRSVPVKQVSLAALRQQVSPELLVGRRVLVVGGSRGVGEVIAKVALAMGAQVHVTYHRGSQEVDQLIQEASQESLLLTSSPLNVLQCTPNPWPELWQKGPFDLLTYFATPAISLNPYQGWQQSLFDKYMSYYVAPFMRLAEVAMADKQQPAQPMVMLQPSTIFVAEPTVGALEYAGAKSALEICGRYLEAQHPSLAVLTPRLPRLLTDQTGMLDAELVKDPVPEVITLLKQCARS
ncbi:MaoC/PaaZ C-terminal domain-containing protein [Magnetococcus sp. PR-3]|uniref:MaoC/PaaZ C-terminal domain-containing protein n=1 Tax=Magnetococcus sp. PR-3 TaxID=3120355 RepID=UPI002FCDF797